MARKPKVAKQRIDALLVERELAEDLTQARKWIMAGLVLVNDTPIDKPGSQVPIDGQLRLRGKSHNYVGRGGLKLEAAIKHWDVAFDGQIALDLGSSTGGFTDCMLRRGAQKVYAVDVGSNQLDYRLRTDPRVVVLEQTHAKQLEPTRVPDPIAFLTVDVSFTSLTYVLPYVAPLMAAGGKGLLLFKPQFELSREQIDPGGIARDQAAIDAARQATITWLEAQDWQVIDQIKSPVKGREGNQEYWLYVRRTS